MPSVTLEDLRFLSRNDLRAVFQAAGKAAVLPALWAMDGCLREHLLRTVGSPWADELRTWIGQMPPPALDTVRLAQLRLVDALRRLSRSGLIAYDVPEDLVA
jgi:flagellar motor switch protein FliG